uniref:Kinesin motor domain-containing protein n=1 Tax=Pelusios castaneus TaxID=367368 RepID=A0A8C8SWR9_9SAUR
MSAMDAGQTKPEACVRVAVGLRSAAGSGKQENFRVVNEDSSRLIFVDKADKGIQEGCFTFDGIFSLDTGQAEVFLELVRPLLAMVPLGYSMSLLLWEAHRSRTELQHQVPEQHRSIIQQVIETVFQEPKSPGDSADCLPTVSFVQLCADGNTQDLLSPRTKALHVMDVSPLGLVVEEASEIVVSNSKAACSVYVSGLEDSVAPSQAGRHAAMCASLFTLTMERELEDCRRQRSAVRILQFPGGAEPSMEPLSPLFQALVPGELPDNAGFLPWILKRMLEGNNFTFLLLCLTLPDASGEEILSALSLAEQVRRLPKKVLPLHWDPAEAVWRRRVEIQSLRAQLLSSSSLPAQENVIGPLKRALRELQVLKKQRRVKKREPVEAFEGNGSRHPEAKKGSPLRLGGEKRLTSPLLTDTPRSQELLDRGSPKPDGDVAVPPPSFPAEFAPLSKDRGGEATRSSPRPFGPISPGEEAAKEEKLLQRAASRTKEPTCTASGTGTVGSWASEQHQALELQFAMAKARRQHLQEQHQCLIQQALLKLEEERVGSQELPAAQREVRCWPTEKAALAVQLEALQRERSEAEKDLEALFQQHRLEAEAQKRHVLQVFQAYRGLSEAHTDALEQRYRKLLQETLQDAISLSAQNQQLQARSQLGCTDRAMQTDPQDPAVSCAMPEQQPSALNVPRTWPRP